MSKAVSATKLASLKKCNHEQEEIGYFTFYPLTIFCFFLASDKFLLIDDMSLYNNNVVIALTVCRVLTHEFCIHVIFISVYEVYWSNFDKSHICNRPRVLELNSLLAIVSIFALSLTATFGALVESSAETLTSTDIAVVVIPFWIFTKIVLVFSVLYVIFRRASIV